jgi:hypothetical protein
MPSPDHALDKINLHVGCSDHGGISWNQADGPVLIPPPFLLQICTNPRTQFFGFIQKSEIRFLA